jgi:arginine deiminase
MGFHVDSEVGRLRQVVLHRPDLELKRLTPANRDDFLFDDVLWVKRAKQEHDAFAETLRDLGRPGAPVRRAAARDAALPEAKAYLLDRVFDERVHGRWPSTRCATPFDAMDDDRSPST